MFRTRPHRIVRRAVMALAGGVSLVAWYIATYLGTQYCAGRGVVAKATAKHLNETVFAPLFVSDIHDEWSVPWVSYLGLRAYYAGVAELKSAQSAPSIRPTSIQRTTGGE